LSFEEQDDCFIWYCDQCNHFAAFKPHDFYACVAELKARGWSFTHHTDEGGWDWTHACPKHRRKLGELLKMKFSEVK
jgi:hypothetical protein